MQVTVRSKLSCISDRDISDPGREISRLFVLTSLANELQACAELEVEGMLILTDCRRCHVCIILFVRGDGGTSVPCLL